MFMRRPRSSDLRRRWKSQISARYDRLSACWPRTIGALGYLIEGPDSGPLVDLHRLILVVVRDETIGQGRIAIRVVGYQASRIDYGVHWGGHGAMRFYKDLFRSPRPFAKGPILDSRYASLLELSLRLDHRIEQGRRQPQSIRQNELKLPRMWAGFPKCVADDIRGDGPELEALCRKFGMNARSMLNKFRRQVNCLTLFPADWVSDRLNEAGAIFGDVAGMPARQAFSLDNCSDTLVGYMGATSFGLYEGRRRRVASGVIGR
jgi:hypothetical protein